MVQRRLPWWFIPAFIAGGFFIEIVHSVILVRIVSLPLFASYVAALMLSAVVAAVWIALLSLLVGAAHVVSGWQWFGYSMLGGLVSGLPKVLISAGLAGLSSVLTVSETRIGIRILVAVSWSVVVAGFQALAFQRSGYRVAGFWIAASATAWLSTALLQSVILASGLSSGVIVLTMLLVASVLPPVVLSLALKRIVEAQPAPSEDASSGSAEGDTAEGEFRAV